MNQFAKLLRSEWRQLALPDANNKIVVAVSGGADSVSLLAALGELRQLKKLNVEIFAAHFNHDLRGAESDGDTKFVKDLASKFEFEFVCGKSNFSLADSKDNLEQAARRARYDFLFKTAHEKSAAQVLTAHTLDDQAETFLLRLLRGSGADGLGAMRAITNYELRITNYAEKDARQHFEQAKIKDQGSKSEDHFQTIKLVRPLLAWARRAMTEDYCRAVGIEFRLDAMNDDERFARVKVRKQLLPLLKIFNPKIVETLAQTADLLCEQAHELNQQAEKWLAANGYELLADDCAALTPVLRHAVLRLWLRGKLGGLRRITKKHLNQLDTLIVNRIGNRTIELPGSARVVRQQNRLVFLAQVEKTRHRN